VHEITIKMKVLSSVNPEMVSVVLSLMVCVPALPELLVTIWICYGLPVRVTKPGFCVRS